MILRSIATTTTAIAATALPAAYIASSLSSSSSSSSPSPIFKPFDFRFLFPQSILSSGVGTRLGLAKNFISPPSALQMEDAKSSHVCLSLFLLFNFWFLLELLDWNWLLLALQENMNLPDLMVSFPICFLSFFVLVLCNTTICRIRNYRNN